MSDFKYRNTLPTISRTHRRLLPALGASLALILAIELAVQAFIWPDMPVLVFLGVLWLAAYSTLATIALWLQSRREGFTESMLRSVLDKSKAGRLILDAKGLPVCLNEEALRLTNERPTAEGLAHLFSRAKTATTFAWLQEQAKTPGGASIDLEAGVDSGEWYNVSVNPVADMKGFVQWRLANITQRRHYEEERQAERAKLIDFLDNAPGGFFSVGADGQFLFVNRTFAQWVGASVTKLLSGDYRLHDFLATPPEGKPYDLITDGGQVQHCEVLFKALDGQLLPASVTQTVVDDGDGSGIRTRAVVRDLIEEREWQAALAQSQRRFQRFFEDAPSGIALIDTNGAVIECNDMMASMIGRPLEEVVGLKLSDLVTGDDQGRISSLVASPDPEALEHPLEARLRGEAEKTVQIYVRLLHEADSDERTVILHFIDLTEQKNLERQFSQSQKMQAVGQLAGGIAHDFNNLLTAMIGFCDLLLLRHKPGDSSFGDIMQIKQNANRAANLVRQLLAFSRQQTLQPRVLDVTDALTELLHLLRRLIGENIELKIVHGRELGLVKVDQGQFEQVLINLCVNARDAMPRGGKLTIKTTNRRSRSPLRLGGEEMPAGEWVVISVTDTGVGIPRDIITRIFEPFFSTKEVGSGTGLGLSTVYGIVRQTGGYVHVESEPGEGTTFYIYLPRHSEADGGVVAPVQIEAQDKGAGDLTGVGQILLVEDEDAVRMFSSRALKNKGYNVLEANSGEDALRVLSELEKPIDLLITDVIMPQMDGPTLVEEVRRTQPDLKVIFISGYTEDRVRSQFASGEEIHFLPKPFTLKQLAMKVKDVMFPGE
jgi:two-component system cell cycle sensor histidine kinase/response regulator CckA